MQANIRRIVSILLAVMFCVACFTGCGSSNNGGSDTASVDVRNAKTIADLKGAKIAAQAGTFHLWRRRVSNPCPKADQPDFLRA